MKRHLSFFLRKKKICKTLCDKSLNSPWHLFFAILCFMAGNPSVFQVQCLCCLNTIAWNLHVITWETADWFENDGAGAWWTPAPTWGMNGKQDQALRDCISHWYSHVTRKSLLKRSLISTIRENPIRQWDSVARRMPLVCFVTNSFFISPLLHLCLVTEGWVY